MRETYRMMQLNLTKKDENFYSISGLCHFGIWM
jgi:hypothetical protein